MLSRFPSREQFPVVASVLSPQALAMEMSQAYPIGQVQACTLLRSYVNDIYVLDTDVSRYVIKVYRAGWRTESEIRYELDFLVHLDRSGIGVSLPLPKQNGGLLHTILAPEGLRYVVLYHFAKGDKPRPPFSDALYCQLGRELARIHTASMELQTVHKRFHLDIEYLLDKPLGAIRPFLKERTDDWAFLEDLSREVRKQIRHLDSNGLSRAVCHGDVSMDNLHVDDEGRITFYDFDAGGKGWSAYDLLGVYMFTKLDGRQSRWESHVEGYREVRELNDHDMRSLPYLHVMNSIWSLGCNATIWAQTSGLWRMSREYLDQQIRDLQRWAEAELG